MSVTELIDYANSLLPGTPASEGENDPRWQAIMELAEYVESNPEEVWAFACKWGGHPQEDIRNAIACCVLEHLLEHHFQSIFPRVEEMVKKDNLFADMFCRCWKFGASEKDENARKIDNLSVWCERHWHL